MGLFFICRDKFVRLASEDFGNPEEHLDRDVLPAVADGVDVLRRSSELFCEPDPLDSVLPHYLIEAQVFFFFHAAKIAKKEISTKCVYARRLPKTKNYTFLRFMLIENYILTVI